MNEKKIARFLGWFSLGLGAAEIAAPRVFTRFLGTKDNPALVRAYGVREIASGVGILAQARPAAWVWSRVAGDALDLATLGATLRKGNPKRRNVGIAMASVASILVLDALTGAKLHRRNR